jgi:hypothetical protein
MDRDPPGVADSADEYLPREAKARINIDRQLVAAGLSSSLQQG